jgi:hypothetical protein
MSTSTDTNPTTSRSSRRRCSLTQATRSSTPTNSVPAVIFIPCHVQPINRWSTDAIFSSTTEDCCMKKRSSFRWDEENTPASSMFTARASISVGSSALSVISNDDMEISLKLVDHTKSVRRCSETSSKLGCQAPFTKMARRSSIGPPTLPRRQRSNVALGPGL